MPGRVRVDVPGRVGPLAEWSVDMAAVPHVATDSNPDTGVVNFIAPSQRNSILAMNNDADFIFRPRDPDAIARYPLESAFDFDGFGEGAFGDGGFGVGSAHGTQTFIDGSETEEVVGHVNGRIDSVEVAGISASFTQATPLTQFATGELSVPPITSGSPFAAFELAWQMAGNRRSTLQYGETAAKGKIPNGVYWSLAGHETGFDVAGKIVNPIDETTYSAQYADAQGTLTDTSGANTKPVTERMWKVTNHYASSGWGSYVDGIYSTSGTGSSVSLTAGRSSIIMFTTPSSLRNDFVLNLGNRDNPGFGPDQSLTSTGKWFTITISPRLKRITITGNYRSSGGSSAITVAGDLYELDLRENSALRVVVQSAFENGAYVLSVTVSDGTGNLGSVSTGRLSTTIDQWSRPWTHTGPMRALYLYDDVTPNVDAQQLAVGSYENDFPGLCSLPNLGIDVTAPILQYTGALWDYLCQICAARQVNLQFNSYGQYNIGAMLDQALRPEVWNPGATPTISIGTDSIAPYVDIQQSNASFEQLPELYDAATADESYSFTPGTTTVFQIETTSIGDFAYTPEPVDDIGGFRDIAHHPWGSYVVTGADDLPISAAEWVSFGGSVSVRKTGPTTLELTVVSATVPGVDGDYSLSVSDGDTEHPCLRIVGQTGSKIITRTRRFQTGAEPAFSLAATGASITNVAATSNNAVNALAVWASHVASGPSLSLSATLPLHDIENWRSQDMLLVPGTTIVYNNIQWRIMTATITDISISITARAYTVYGNPFWEMNWHGQSVDEFRTYWTGKTWDDFKTMVLSGPELDWSTQGATRRWTLYPAGIPVGLTGEVEEPSTIALPANTTVPATPNGTPSTGGPTTVDSTDTTVPGASTYPGSITTPNTTTISIVPDGSGATGPSDGTTTYLGGLYPNTTVMPSQTFPGSFLLPNTTSEPGVSLQYPDGGVAVVTPGSPGSSGNAVAYAFPTLLPPVYPEDALYPGSEEDPYDY